MSAEDLKNQGNAAAKAGDFARAAELYTQAIALDPNNKVYYSNRANVTLDTDPASALKDAEKCIELDPNFTKGYIRKIDALTKLDLVDEAMTFGEEATKKFPGDQTISSKVQSLAGAQLNNMFTGMFGPDMMTKLRANPTTNALLARDPTLEGKLLAMRANPGALLSQGQSDPAIQTCMLVLMGLDPSKMPQREEDGCKGCGDCSSCAHPCNGHASPAANTSSPKKEEPKQPEKEKYELSEEEQLAETLKAAGNELFKHAKYEEALAKYEEAFSHDEKNMLILGNISTTLLKLGKLEEAEKKAMDAYEVGRENLNRFTSEDLAKALTKAGSALYAAKKYDEAIRILKKAMTEFRNKQCLALLNKVEDEKEMEEKKALYNPELAVQKKTEGNELFKKGDFKGAIEKFNEAILHDPEVSAYYTNRSFAFFKVGQLQASYEDAQKAAQLDPNNIKAYLRMAVIEKLRKQYYKAVESYKKVLKMEGGATNQEAIEGIQKTMEKIREFQSNPKLAAEVEAVAMADPDIQKICSDPGLAEVIKAISSNPQAAQQYLSNEAIASRIETLINAGILKISQ